MILERMMDAEVETQALADHELYTHLIEHRESYQRIQWFECETLET